MENENDKVEIKDEDIKEEDFSEDELNDDETDWKAKAQELKGIAKRRATQLGKAKVKLGEFETKLSELKPKEESKPQDKNLDKSQSNEPDYARLAFLETKGVNHPDDQKFIQDEASRLKLPLTDILNMEYVKSRLSALKDQREAQAGMPKGKGSPGGANQRDVDYWLAKGETPDDLELAEKVIDARIKQEKTKNKFSDDLYTG